MSLVGSLEDLGLADILQIVSLSRKSGLLLLRSDAGDGRIVFRDGLVRAATVKGGPEDLRALLVGSGFAQGEVIDAALETARANGTPVDEVVAQRTGLGVERINLLRREHVERAVIRMFAWRAGEFSFDVREDLDAQDRDLALPTGINPQYLTMEATRIGDEGADEEAPRPEEAARPDGPGADEDDGFVLSGEPARPEPPPPEDPHHRVALAAVARVDARPAAPEPAPVRAPSPSPAAPPPLVVIDRELRALEWLKGVLGDTFARVHIFQHAEGGVARVRQYLTRGAQPVVLVSHSVPADSLGGGEGSGALLRRLRSHAPQMAIVLMHDASDTAPDAAEEVDAVVERPAVSWLGNRRKQEEVEALSRKLRGALARWARGGRDVGSEKQGGAASLGRLQEISERLKDPSTRGEVLKVALEFAAESFRRVAMFMVREEEAVGIAQRGLAAAGGPDDAAFRGLRVSLEEPQWFRAVVGTRRARRAPPGDAGDAELAARLGARAPSEALVAPVESGGRVAALLYADNLPGDEPLGDTAALAIVLHEAGLALDRALLERALAAAEGAPEDA